MSADLPDDLVRTLREADQVAAGFKHEDRVAYLRKALCTVPTTGISDADAAALAEAFVVIESAKPGLALINAMARGLG